MAEQFQERQVAVKTSIKEIKEGEYKVEEGWTPNYLLTKKGEKISRVNIMAVVLDKEDNGAMTNLVIDDGSGTIMARSFEEIKNIKEIQIGEGVLVIGKVRLFNNEKYLSPEIVKKIDRRWLKIRALELNKEKTKEETVKEEIEGEGFPDLIEKKVIDLIKKLDQGEGALIEELKEKLMINNTDEMIEKMLEKGEIFQNLPGRVKVL